MVSEHLGCLPSELKDKNVTLTDMAFIVAYNKRKMKDEREFMQSLVSVRK